MTDTERRGTVAVAGAGTMGHGIALVAALGGYTVRLYDVDPARVAAALEQIRASAARLARSGRVDAGTAEAAVLRVTSAASLAEAAGEADVAIEVVPEILDLKRSIFEQLDRAAPADAILATNTSQLSITRIAAATARPERVVGLHFFNPPVLMRLVEVVCGLRTDAATLEAALGFVRAIGKESVVCRKDAAGFITTRALNALRLECIRMHEEGVASVEDIDKALRLGLNHPMGQFELADFNGLDVALRNAEQLHEVYGDRFRPPQSLGLMVAAGRLGRKTGGGWYDYPDGRKTEAQP